MGINDLIAFVTASPKPRADPVGRQAQVRAYREAAAVCASVTNLEQLVPVGTDPAPGTVAELLGPDLIPATGRGFTGSVMLHPRVRADAIQDLLTTGRLDDVLAANQALAGGLLQEQYERYLRGEAPPIEGQSLAELEATHQVTVWVGDVLPGVPPSAEVSARAEYARLLYGFDEVAGDDRFRGRHDERRQLRDFVASDGGPAVLSVHGPGGVGKSALVARQILDLARDLDGPHIPFAYLDFDRDGLDVGEPLALCVEMLRQLDLQFPGDGRFAGLRERGVAGLSGPEKSQNRLTLAQDLLRDVLDRIDSVLGPQPYVVVLDTFEAVQFRGVSRAFPFWQLLASYSNHRLRIMVAGRAPVEASETSGLPVTTLLLDDLDDSAARKFLADHGITDPNMQGRMIGMFGRMPLTLKLVTSLANRTPGGAGALVGAGSVTVSDELTQAQLYGRLLAHIADPQVRLLAHPGLVLRRVNPEIIWEVLNTTCGLGLTSLDGAGELFGRLRQEVSLVAVDDTDGDLVHRSDLRRVMLRLLVRSQPALVDDIRRAAVAWYARRGSRRDRAEEAYHRIHLLDWPDPQLFTDSEVRAGLQAVMSEFPPETQRRLAGEGFQVPGSIMELASRHERDASAAAQIEELLAYGPSALESAESSYGRFRDDLADGSPLYRALARLAVERHEDPRARDLTGRGLEASVRSWTERESLLLLREDAWQAYLTGRGDRGVALDRLGEHARRFDDPASQLLYQLLAGGDAPVLGALVEKVRLHEVAGLIPAFGPIVRRGAATLLDLLRAAIEAPDNPLRHTVFPDPDAQAALEVLEARNGPFRDAFLGLCEAWPYRNLFVRLPYGRTGEQLAESAV